MKKRFVTRSLAATLMVGPPLVLAAPAHAQADPSAGGLSSPEDGPLVWQGEVPGATDDAVVIVHARSTGADEPTVGTELPIIEVGRAMRDDDGLFRVYGSAGTWYGDLADSEGRVTLMVTAVNDGGTELGVSAVNVQFTVPAGGAASRGGEPSDGVWHVDEQTAASGALLEFDEFGNLASPAGGLLRSAVDGADVVVPTSTFNMAPAPASPAGSAATRASYSPNGFLCTGTSIVRGYTAENWLDVGRFYHEAYGPSETLLYQTSRTTSSEWGYKIGFDTGFLNAAGRVSFSTSTSVGTAASSTALPEGKKQRAEGRIGAKYRVDELTECKYVPASGPPPVHPGGFSMAAMVPQRWTTKTKYARTDIGATPAQDDGPTNRVTIDGLDTRARTSGVTSGLSKGVEIGAKVSGKTFSLTGSTSFSTSTSAGSVVTRTWKNNATPATGIKKYVKGYGGHPLESGVVAVRGF